MIKALQLSALLAAGVILIGAPVPADKNIRLVETTIPKFSETQPPEGVLRALARMVFLKGTFGVEELDGDETPITTVGEETTIGGILQNICKQEPRYRVVASDDVRILNILSTDETTPSEHILNFRIPQVDIEIDDTPDHLIRELPDYSVSLRDYLKKIYVAEGGKDLLGGIQGARMTTDQKPPHFSIHAKEISVREFLNLISAKSLDMHDAIGLDPRLVTTPNQLRLVPTGWELRIGNAKETSFLLWSHSIFDFFQ